MKLPSKINIYTGASVISDFLNGEGFVKEEGQAYIKDICGYDFSLNNNAEVYLDFLKDNTVWAKVADDYQQYKDLQMFENTYDKLGYEVHSPIKDKEVIVLGLLKHSLAYLLINTSVDFREIHNSIFGEELYKFKNEDTNGPHLDSQSLDDYLRLKKMKLFSNNALLNNAYLSSILHYCINYEAYRNGEVGVGGCWELVNRKKLRELLKMVCPTTYDLTKSLIKNKDNLVLYSEGKLGRFIQRYANQKTITEFKSLNSEHIFYHSTLIVSVLELKEEQVENLFKSHQFSKLYLMYAKIGHEANTLKLKEKFGGEKLPVTMTNRAIVNIIRKKRVDGRLLQIDDVIDSFDYKLDFDKMDGRLNPEFENRSFVNHTISEVNKFLKNKGNTLKKFQDGDTVNFEFFNKIMELLSMKTVAVTGMGDAKDCSSDSQKKLRIREALDMIHITGFFKNDLPVMNYDARGLVEASKYASTINTHCMEHGVSEEILFLMMAMNWTLMEEISILSGNVVNTDHVRLKTSEYESKRENIELTAKVRELEEEIERLKEENALTKNSVDREVERRTEEYYLANYKLERQVHELQDKCNSLTDKYENLINLNNELHHDYEELLNKTDEDDKEDMTEMLNYLRNRKVAIAGGYPRVLQSLQRLLPDVFIIPKEGPSMNLKSLDNNDLILIYTSYMSHGFFYGIKANTTFDERYIRMDKPVNAHEMIRRAYKHLKELEKASDISSNPLD